MQLVKEFLFPIGRGRRGKFKVYQVDSVEQGEYTTKKGRFMTVRLNKERTFSGFYDDVVVELQSKNPNTTILYESPNGLIVCCMPGPWRQHLREEDVYKKLKGSTL